MLAELAHLSDTLFAAATAAYSIAMVGFGAEQAFGAARPKTTPAPARRVLVGAGGAVLAADADGGARSQGAESAVPEDAAAGATRAGPARLGRAAVAATVLGVILHAASIAIRGAAVDRVPWGNMYEFSSLVGLVAALAFLAVLARQPAARRLGGFVMLPVIVVMFLAGTVLYARAEPLVPALRSYWLAIHVSAAATSTGVFMVSFVATALYLLRAGWDRAAADGRPARFPASLGARLPAADSLDRMAYRTAAFAFPIWTFGIICGAIWAEAAWGRYWGWDPKETWAFIAWVIYAAYLHARATAGWKGAKAGWVNVLGFAAMTFNFFIVNIVISGLHSYAGLN